MIYQDGSYEWDCFSSGRRKNGPENISIVGYECYPVAYNALVNIFPDGDIEKVTHDPKTGRMKKFIDIDILPKMSPDEKILEEWLDSNGVKHDNPPPRELIEKAFPKLDLQEIDYLIRKPDRIYERFTDEHTD